MKILLILYDFFLFFGFLLYLPIYAWRKKITLRALIEKLGFLKSLTKQGVIWLQVVSVGEVNVIGSLIKKIKEHYANPILVSTTTLTGNKIAKDKYSAYAQVVYFPLDISIIVWNFIRIFKPKVFIAVETEIWPNLFAQLHARGIPILIINGRISDKAFRRYRRFRYLLKSTINQCSKIAVQNQMYKERFCFLGADAARVVVGGNMKFESIVVDQGRALAIEKKYASLLKSQGKLLVVAGCTHPGEEEILLKVCKDIADPASEANLLIAPRHPERAAILEKIARSQGFNPLRLSQISDSGLNSLKISDNTAFILDIVGELLYFYRIADICFVGGSLSEDGGHNILEPVYFNKPVVFGPHMDNFLDIEEVVLGKGAGIKVDGIEQLRQTLMRLVKDSALRRNLGNHCREVFQQERQSLENNLGIVLEAIDSKEKNV